MAFDKSRLKAIGGQDNRHFGGDVYSYTHPSDSLTVILGVDYFIDSFEAKLLDNDDIIWINHPQGMDQIKIIIDAVSRQVTSILSGASVLTLAITQTGPLFPDVDLIEFTQTGGPFTLTLQDGQPGQRITVIKIDDNANVASLQAVTQMPNGGMFPFTFNAQGDRALLIFSTLGWAEESLNIT